MRALNRALVPHHCSLTIALGLVPPSWLSHDWSHHCSLTTEFALESTSYFIGSCSCAQRSRQLMRAVRYRLRAHAGWASEIVICEANLSQTSRGSIPPRLLSHSRHWLTEDERRTFGVTHLVVAGLMTQRAVDMLHKGFGSTTMVLPSLWSDLIAWLERERPNRRIFAAGPDEVLDAAHMVQLLAQAAVEPSTHTRSARPTLAGHVVRAGLVSEAPLAPWLHGGCAIPRLRGFRFGHSNCSLPDRPYETDKVRGWARSAFLFNTFASWASWRGRRSVVLMAEPPEQSWIKWVLRL
jgi:hypothetical protein